MDSIAEQNGKCLCGSVRLIAKPKNGDIGVCHCDMCRKWGGGPFFAAACENHNMRFEGAEHIAVFSSSEWAERGFCQKCGTHLFYRLKQGEHYAIPVGLFDSSEEWQLDEQIFIDKKPPFYSFREKTRELTEAEVLAEYFGA